MCALWQIVGRAGVELHFRSVNAALGLSFMISAPGAFMAAMAAGKGGSRFRRGEEGVWPQTSCDCGNARADHRSRGACSQHSRSRWRAASHQKAGSPMATTGNHQPGIKWLLTRALGAGRLERPSSFSGKPSMFDSSEVQVLSPLAEFTAWPLGGYRLHDLLLIRSREPWHTAAGRS